MNVCNMEEMGTIEIHKDDGKYYLNIIVYDEIAEFLEISDGFWTESEISERLLNKLLKVISQADYVKTRGHELDHFCTINGKPFSDVSRIGLLNE